MGTGKLVVYDAGYVLGYGYFRVQILLELRSAFLASRYRSLGYLKSAIPKCSFITVPTVLKHKHHL